MAWIRSLMQRLGYSAGGFDARSADHGRLDRAEPLAKPTRARKVERDDDGGGQTLRGHPPGAPFNHGEMTYAGEGAYEGLVVHYYFAGGNDVTGVAGWIANAPA